MKKTVALIASILIALAMFAPLTATTPAQSSQPTSLPVGGGHIPTVVLTRTPTVSSPLATPARRAPVLRLTPVADRCLSGYCFGIGRWR
jgi:hypothetical protein